MSFLNNQVLHRTNATPCKMVFPKLSETLKPRDVFRRRNAESEQHCTTSSQPNALLPFWDKNKRPKYQGVAHSHSVPRDGEVSEDKDVAKALMPTWCPEVRKGSERRFIRSRWQFRFFLLPGIMEKLPVEKLWILSCKNAHKT